MLGKENFSIMSMDKDGKTTETIKAQYLADVDRVVRDLFGAGARIVTIHRIEEINVG